MFKFGSSSSQVKAVINSTTTFNNLQLIGAGTLIGPTTTMNVNVANLAINIFGGNNGFNIEKYVNYFHRVLLIN